MPDRSDAVAKGFGGLGSMVSDVTADIAPRREATPRRASATSVPTDRDGAATTTENRESEGIVSANTGAVRRDPGTSPRGGKGVFATLSNALLIFVGIAVLVALLNSKDPSSTGGGGDHAGPGLAATGVQPDAPAEPLQAPRFPVSDNGTEDQPPVQSGRILTEDQIRYCVAERIRIEAMETAIDLAAQDEVEFHNEKVRDLNSRCGSFRYRSGVLQAVTAEVESRRAVLEQVGRDRFRPFRAVVPQRSSPDTQGVLEAPSSPTEPATAPPSSPAPDDGAADVTKEASRVPQDPETRYAALVMQQANGAVTYPRYALRRGEEGTVEVQVTVSAAGSLRNAVVQRSSGYPALDEAALNVFVQGIDLPPPPEPLIGTEFTVTVPITFKTSAGARQ